MNWFTSYLSFRQQCVAIIGITSGLVSINIGVPQGSVLGPILFLIYIYDLTQYITNGQCNIFADDNIIYTNGKSLPEVNTKLQLAVNQVDIWYKENKLNVNADKCDTILVTSHHRQINHGLNITIDGTKINQSSSVKYLGITVTNTLNWNPHIITNICAKIRPIIAMINRMKKWLPASVLQTMYTSYVQPHIDYGITVWGNSPAASIYNLQRQQNLMARIITNNFDYINQRGSDILKDLGLYNIKQRYNYLLSCLTYKCLHNLAPTVLCNCLNKLSDINEHPLRTNTLYNLAIPRIRTNKLKEAFFINAPYVWNNLPLELQMADSIACFKCNYKMLMN